MVGRVLTTAGVLIGGLDAILSLLVAFGVNITPDQHTAIASVSGLLLLVVSAWFHPNIPIGVKKA